MPSLSDEIYRRLRDEIIGGVFPAGEALREQNLATRYGSSRTPVRNALKRLDEEGGDTPLAKSRSTNTFMG